VAGPQATGSSAGRTTNQPLELTDAPAPTAALRVRQLPLLLTAAAAGGIPTAPLGHVVGCPARVVASHDQAGGGVQLSARAAVVLLLAHDEPLSPPACMLLLLLCGWSAACCSARRVTCLHAAERAALAPALMVIGAAVLLREQSLLMS
jgi:hypothetical protein